MIRAEHVSHDFMVQQPDNEENGEKKVFRALDDISLTIEKGSFVAVLGHNGSGKSTFAKHLNAFLFPTEGSITVGRIDTVDTEQIWELRRNVGMVFQNPDNQIIGSIVEEDTAFGPENLGVPTAEIGSLVEESLSAVKMLRYAKHSPNKLSGGQKQRIAIAGVLAMRPSCIVLDEPTAMLDPSGRREVMKTIKRLYREGITIILITHYMEEAIEADHVFVIDHGKIALEGSPRQIFSQVEKMKELGLDVPPMAELAYRLKKDGYPLSGQELTIEEMAEALCRLKSKD